MKSIWIDAIFEIIGYWLDIDGIIVASRVKQIDQHRKIGHNHMMIHYTSEMCTRRSKAMAYQDKIFLYNEINLTTYEYFYEMKPKVSKYEQ